MLVLDISRTNTFYHTASQFVDQLSQLLNPGGSLSRLRKLDISENLIGDAAGTELLQSLCKLNELEELRMSDDHLGDKFILTFSLAAFSTRLRKLDLSKNQFFDFEMLAIKLCSSHRSLARVDLTQAIPRSGFQELRIPDHLLIIGAEGLIYSNP